MSHNPGCKWAALVFAVLWLMLLACCAGTVLGSVIGFRMASLWAHDARRTPPLPEVPVVPSTPLIPLPSPDLDPDSPSSADTPWLGLAFGMVDEGALVALIVPQSPAETAGLRVNDIITQVGQCDVDYERPLHVCLAPYAPGDRVRLTVLRDEETFEVTVCVGSQPGTQPLILDQDG